MTMKVHFYYTESDFITSFNEPYNLWRCVHILNSGTAVLQHTYSTREKLVIEEDMIYYDPVNPSGSPVTTKLSYSYA